MCLLRVCYTCILTKDKHFAYFTSDNVSLEKRKTEVCCSIKRIVSIVIHQILKEKVKETDFCNLNIYTYSKIKIFDTERECIIIITKF